MPNTITAWYHRKMYENTQTVAVTPYQIGQKALHKF